MKIQAEQIKRADMQNLANNIGKIRNWHQKKKVKHNRQRKEKKRKKKDVSTQVKP